VEIWINPECSKCRSALTVLDAQEAQEAQEAQYTVRYYLEQPPSTQELEEVLARLGLEPWDIARLGEPAADELGLAGWPRDQATRARWVEALAAHPMLIQRPIITAADGTATIARTPEAVEAALRRTNSPDLGDIFRAVARKMSPEGQ
jgi:arsenate reductase